MKKFIVGSESHDQPYILTSIVIIEADSIAEAKTKYCKPIHYMYITIVLGELIENIPHLVTELSLKYSFPLQHLPFKIDEIVFIDEII